MGQSLRDHQDRETCFTILWLFCVGLELGEGTMSLPGFWRCSQEELSNLPGRKLTSSTHPVSSLLAFSSHTTCALPAVALVLNPRGGGSAYVLSPCRPFNWSLLNTGSFFCRPKPHWFLQPEVMGIYLLGTGTLGCWVVLFGTGIPCS